MLYRLLAALTLTLITGCSTSFTGLSEMGRPDAETRVRTGSPKNPDVVGVPFKPGDPEARPFVRPETEPPATREELMRHVTIERAEFRAVDSWPDKESEIREAFAAFRLALQGAGDDAVKLNLAIRQLGNQLTNLYADKKAREFAAPRVRSITELLSSGLTG
jgi:hypothetical protein